MRNTLLALFLAALLAGCAHHRNTPSASDTVLRSTYSDSVASSEDYLGATSVNPDSLAAEGLQMRDSSFNDISSKNLEKGILPSIYFEFNKSALNSDARASLAKAADYLKANPTRKVLMEGHCDWRGTAEYNLGLGERRAKSAKTYLTSLGIDEARLGTVSKGDLEAATNGTEDQMAKDRRVDLQLLK